MTISLEEHVALLKKALEPFAELALGIPDTAHDVAPAFFMGQDARHPGTFTTINNGAFRRARAAIAAVHEHAPDPSEAMRAKCEAQEWEGYINGLTRAGNLRSRLVVDDSTGRVLNDIRRQIQDEIEKAQVRIAALKGKGEGR